MYVLFNARLNNQICHKISDIGDIGDIDKVFDQRLQEYKINS